MFNSDLVLGNLQSQKQRKRKLLFIITIMVIWPCINNNNLRSKLVVNVTLKTGKLSFRKHVLQNHISFCLMTITI